MPRSGGEGCGRSESWLRRAWAADVHRERLSGGCLGGRGGVTTSSRWSDREASLAPIDGGHLAHPTRCHSWQRLVSKYSPFLRATRVWPLMLSLAMIEPSSPEASCRRA